uniref:Glucosyltransferase 24 catalytic domain-containing protein n=1 Tax=Ditylenchus dipsaci TaxID=166011 RepID=A0A915CU59_9BILA
MKEEPRFNTQGRLLSPSVSFKDLPAKQLLTLNVIAPNSWMVQPVYAEYDLDNIIMKNTNKDVVSRFELVHILLEGHCFDEASGNPPEACNISWVLKARPIAMTPLSLDTEVAGGKSKEIYEIKSCTEAESHTHDQANVLIDSFMGKTVRIRVAKRPGMENRNLLNADSNAGDTAPIEDEEEGDGNSIWSTISSKLTGGEKHEKINIFSLASGHLYERFIKIMMLSVIKNTKHPVKFWLLNNYLSPNFREVLPKMAEKYGFEFELIEYKWPRWLHQQTEKQRIMWGYKILFLDVLFPLDVKKIIFVDADQVIRADMMELMNLDLGGAPYGYAPFCESRTTMDGFRFWKQGYWANHLAGRKYHISALYVVDLAKFRQIAAGDRLRGQYQGLSSDPNSLSNLDQDLPNNMIHQVRIKTLPQEWLWCETWCDDSSKKEAKTIDLCNNPQTKEPKLDSAMRIIPEWTEYDNEIRSLLRAINSSTTNIPSSTPTEAGENEQHGGEL